jgi:hypothetical protein
MSPLHNLSCSRCFRRGLVATAVATPLTAIFGRKALPEDKDLTLVPGAPLSAHSHALGTYRRLLSYSRCRPAFLQSDRHSRSAGPASRGLTMRDAVAANNILD